MADPLAAYGELPVASPPPGITANFTNPQDIGYQAIAASVVCLVLILFFVGCRLAAKLLGMGKGQAIWTDVLFMTGVALSIANLAATIATVETGPWGKHEWDVKLKEYTKPTAMLLILMETSFAICLGFIKVTLLVMYLEIFGRITWLRYSAYFGIVLISLFHASTAIAYGIMCGPRPGQGHSRLSYMISLASDSCRNTNKISLAQGGFNMTTDLFLLILPLPAIKALQLPRKLKLGVFAMFFTGVLAFATSCIGMYYRVRLAQYEHDSTWYMIPGMCAVTGELTAGIIIFCMPSMTQLIKRWKQRHVKNSQMNSEDKYTSRPKNSRDKSSSSWDQTTADENRASSYVVKETINRKRDSGTGFIFVPGAPSRAECWVEHGSDTSSFDQEIPKGNDNIIKKTEVKIVRVEP